MAVPVVGALNCRYVARICGCRDAGNGADNANNSVMVGIFAESHSWLAIGATVALIGFGRHGARSWHCGSRYLAGAWGLLKGDGMW